MGCGVKIYSISYVIGIYAYILLHLHKLYISPAINLIVCTVLTITALFKRNNNKFFFTSTVFVFFILGINAGSLQINKSNTEDENTRKEVLVYLSGKLKKFTPEQNEHSILCAISLGIKENIPQDLIEAYSNAGVMHILALSGLHIGIIYIIVCLFLLPFNIHYKLKRYKLIISLLIISLYSYVTGGSPSITRAAVMICIHAFINIANRSTDKWSNLALCAFIMGIINPGCVTQIGFQLSFAAIIGIMAIYPVISQSIKIFVSGLRCNRFLKVGIKKLLDIIWVSVSCQITTLPLVLYYFGNWSQHFILANIVAIPLTTLILYMLVIGIATLPIPFVNSYIASALNLLIKIMNYLINYISDSQHT